MVGTDAFGDFGCGMFVAAAYGVSGIGYGTAKQFGDALAAQGTVGHRCKRLSGLNLVGGRLLGSANYIETLGGDSISM
jgi:hypothetical protein